MFHFDQAVDPDKIKIINIARERFLAEGRTPNLILTRQGWLGVPNGCYIFGMPIRNMEYIVDDKGNEIMFTLVCWDEF